MNDSTEPLGAVYRFYDDKGDLLYVGRTYRMPDRLAEHRRDKAWWSSVATIKLEWMPHAELHNAEMEAIRTENPRHNVAMTHRARETYRPPLRKRDAVAELGAHFYSIGNELEARAVLNVDRLDELALMAGLDRRQMIQEIVAEHLERLEVAS
jgi:predicted GIY-YIG superfamily endonuclease